LYSPLTVACLAGVISLTPVALYLLWLSILTRRDRPTLLPGAWDFTILLAGLSGFILFGGGLLLTLMQSNVRYFMRGNFEALREAWGKEHLAWVLTVLAYLMFVIGGSLLTLQARRRSLVVYNIEPDQFEAVLGEIFEHLNRPVERRGNLWVGGVPLCEVEPFTAGQTVTFRWLSEDVLLFQEVERQLHEAVKTISSPDNPATRWLSSAVAGCSIVLIFLVVVIFIYRGKL